MKLYRVFTKPFFEILLLIIFIWLWLPLFVIIYCILFLTSNETVLFKQERIGFKGRSFKIIKFRTMSNSRDNQGHLLPDFRRITPFGKFLRNSSLDELPGIINIIRGEMSLIGPRPFIAKYRNLYSSEQFARHNVKPGITGWAQTNGRNKITWKEKFDLDLYYVNNQSFKLDLLIILRTIHSIIFSANINNSDHNTMPEFNGKN